MKIVLAIPIFGDLVSTTFDFAEKLLVVVADGHCEIERKEVNLGDEASDDRVRKLRELGVQVLICGAISRPLAVSISKVGIQVIPYVTGQVDQVLAAYLCGRITEPEFLQAGCGAGDRRRWRQRGGFCGCGRGYYA